MSLHLQIILFEHNAEGAIFCTRRDVSLSLAIYSSRPMMTRGVSTRLFVLLNSQAPAQSPSFSPFQGWRYGKGFIQITEGWKSYSSNRVKLVEPSGDIKKYSDVHMFFLSISIDVGATTGVFLVFPNGFLLCDHGLDL